MGNVAVPFLRRATFALAALVAPIGALAIVPAVVGAQQSTSTSCSASSGKCFGLTLAPSSPSAGSGTTFNFGITNEASTQDLGSVQITAPSGFLVTAAPGSSSFGSTSATYLNLSLAPGASTTLALTATAPCAAETYQWGIEAKQSNAFNGPPGNDFQIDTASASALNGTVAGSCSLAFAGQPAGTSAGSAITTGFRSTGGPVTVDVLNGSGQLATGSAASVTLAIGSNPGSGTLSGTTSVVASGGVASFSGMSINMPGIGYTIAATSPGMTGTASKVFTIWGSLSTCAVQPCISTSSTKTTTGTVQSSSVTSGEYLGVGLGGVTYSCGSTYTSVSDPLSFDVLSSSGVPQGSAQFSVSLEISKQAVQSSGHPGASTWQICYASTTPFTASSGTAGTTTIAGSTYYTGLLPDCSSTTSAPCVQARNKDNAGDVVVTFLASGDPVGRG